MTAPGQADEYTPSEEEVRDGFGYHRMDGTFDTFEQGKAAFDRFLAGYFTPQAVAEIRQQVREDALEDAALIAEQSMSRGAGGERIAKNIRAAANQTA